MRYLSLSTDASAFNRIANDPDVLPYIAIKGQDSIDFAAFFSDDRNIGFLGDGIAFVAHWLDHGMYEVHSMAIPEARGKGVLLAANEAIRHMFINTPCMELLTRVVDGNLAADTLAKAVGFQLEFERSKAWPAWSGDLDCRFYAIRYHDWVKRQNWLISSGEWFHSEVLGDGQTHEEDRAHDLYVGACVEMVRGGQARKGVILYNRWARFAGYEPVSIVSEEPLVIDIVSHKIAVDGSNVEVLQCL